MGKSFEAISFIECMRLPTISFASTLKPPFASSLVFIIFPMFVVVHGLNSNCFLTLRSFCFSGRWAIPMRQRNPILNVFWPPLTPSKKLALSVAMRFSICKSNQHRACRGKRISDESYLFTSSGNASTDKRAKSVCIWPKKLLKAFPFTLITFLLKTKC